MIATRSFRIAAAGALLVLGVLLVHAAHAAGAREGGPLAIVITYHVPPANRAAFRKAMEEIEVPRFRRWKEDRVLQDARILMNRYADSATWDAMALITFAAYADVERWNGIERTSPAGLSPATLSLTSAIETAPGDIVRERGAGQEHAAVLVIPYEVIVPANEYLAYLDGYVLPQVDGWRDEGMLSRYGIFIARYPAGRPWQSMLILEYRDDAALGERDATTAKVRARLASDTKWKAISDTKKNVRNEKAPVIADALPVR